MNIETLVWMGAGGGLVLLGTVVGRFSNPRRGKSERPPAAVCSCNHGYGMHDKTTGKCNGSVQVQQYNNSNGRAGWKQFPCACLHYDGPTPIEQYFATQTLPPKDA